MQSSDSISDSFKFVTLCANAQDKDYKKTYEGFKALRVYDYMYRKGLLLLHKRKMIQTVSYLLQKVAKFEDVHKDYVKRFVFGKFSEASDVTFQRKLQKALLSVDLTTYNGLEEMDSDYESDEDDYSDSESDASESEEEK